MCETQFVTGRFQLLEFVGHDKPADRHVVLAWLQVLTHRKHVAIVGPQVFKHIDNFINALTDTHHETTLGGDGWMLRLELGQ